MKISKVRENKGKLTINAKTAIVSEKNVQEGILYTDPSRQGIGRKSAEDRDRYIDDRIRRSKVLYTIFNEEKSSGKKDEDAAALKMISSIWKKAVNLSRMLKENDAVFEAYAEKSLANRRSHIEQSPAFTELPIRCNVQKAAELQNIICKENLLSRMKSEISSYRTPAEITEHNIDDIINRRLKKSLCRESAKKGLKALLMEAFCRDHQVPADVDIQRDFIDLMLEDYYRVRVKGQVARSIKNKNMPVQPTAGNENVHFAIPVAEKNTKAGKTKKEEQEAFNAFLSSYADLNTENRNQQLLRLRRLVNLYFYGAGETTDPDVWEDHARHRAIKEAFIDAPKEVKTENPSEKRRAEKEREEKIRELFRNKNIACYRAAIAEAEKDNNGRCFENLIPEKDQPGVPFSEKDHSGRFFEDGMLNRFFIHRMESALERIYTHYKNGQEYKLQTGYLSEKIWKDMLNYLSVKYIAIGKAVYNYAMDETADKSEVIEPGKINEAYVSGISSFDYELIKAEEMLQRETAVYVAFAARHLAHQTVDLDEKNSDFLLLKEKGKMKDGQPAEDNIIRFVKKDIDLKRVILQFFGGRSQWQDFPFDRYMADGKDDTDLLYVLKSVIYSMRNDSFHYATENHDEGSWNKVIRDLVSSMFAYEAERISAVQKDKFYTNNLPMFYSQKDLKQTLTGLYREHVERASQVPSFNAVFVRKKFPDTAVKELGINETGMSEEQKLKFHNALYYMFKEIYYNLFLQDKKVLDRFVQFSTAAANGYSRTRADELRKDRQKKEEYKRYEAENDFAQRVLSIQNAVKEITLPQICQMIMTEYNQQNAGNRRKKSAEGSKRNPDSYQHYKMLLLGNLKKAFIQYIKETQKYLLEPDTHSADNKCTKEEFLPDFSGVVQPYKKLCDKMALSPELQKWYVVGRFLSPKQANHLLGSLRSYKQFVRDIYRRAAETGVNINQRVSADRIAGVEIRDMDAVLDLCVKLSGTTSNILEDYFEDKEDYAKYLVNYLDFEYKEGEYAWALKEFCNDTLTAEQKISIYYDGENPVMNRNIVLSKLFGEESLLSNIVTRVNRADFKEYYQVQKEIQAFQTKGIFDTEDEQKAIKRFQEIKNHIEFRDLVDYSEITDELQGQLINWIYMRERDLMYYQLGFHYTCLHNDTEKPEAYKTIQYKGKRIDNAVLYQICAMYTNGLELYYFDPEKNKMDKVGGSQSTGAKIGGFLKYTKGLKEECTYYTSEEQVYNAGLELFENIKEHNDVTELRNYIEHFRYYVKQDRSMLDIYSEVFDRFFTYDMKYRKNVPNILYNILLGYFVNARLEFGSGTKRIGSSKKERASIGISEKGGMISDTFTYQLNNAEPIALEARGRRYLETVAKLLYYPEKPNVEAMVKDDPKNKKKDDKGDGKNNYRTGNKESKEDRRNYEDYKKKNRKSGGVTLGDVIDWDAIMKQLKQ